MCINPVLQETIRLLSPPGSWCQRVNARDRSGVPCDPTSPKAMSRCLYGALHVACTHHAPDDPESLVEEVDEFLFRVWGVTGSAINDDPNATQETILERLRQATNERNSSVKVRRC